MKGLPLIPGRVTLVLVVATKVSPVLLFSTSQKIIRQISGVPLGVVLFCLAFFDPGFQDELARLHCSHWHSLHPAQVLTDILAIAFVTSL